MIIIMQTPTNIGTEDINLFIKSKFEKAEIYKKKLNKSYEECIIAIENSVNLKKTIVENIQRKINYDIYLLTSNPDLLLFKKVDSNEIGITNKAKIYRDKNGINLAITNNYSQQDLEKYIQQLHEEYLNIFNSQLNIFKNKLKTL